MRRLALAVLLGLPACAATRGTVEVTAGPDAVHVAIRQRPVLAYRHGPEDPIPHVHPLADGRLWGGPAADCPACGEKRLRAVEDERDRLLGIVLDLAEEDPVYQADLPVGECFLCAGQDGHHRGNCPWRRAREEADRRHAEAKP